MRITGAAILDEHDGGGAGGAAGSADGGGAAAAQSTSGGDAFSNIVVPPIAAPGGGQDGGNGADGSGADGQEGQDGAEGSNEPPVTYADGRYQTIKELENGYRASGKEGRRLHDMTLANDKTIRGHVDEITQLKAKLERAGKADGFTKLSEEEVNTLRSEEPAKYSDYMRELDKREAAEAAAVEQLETEQKQGAADQERVEDSIDSQVNLMRADTKNYPGYASLQPVMSQLLRIDPGLGGRETSPKVLFYAAYGLQQLKAKAAADKESNDNRDGAAAVAGANNTVTGASGGSVPPAGSKGAPGSDEAFNAALVNAAPGRVLPG